MSVFSCAPQDWFPFSDPSVDIDAVALEMSERAKSDISLPHQPNELERSPVSMKNFLRATRSDGESAYKLWIEWLEWRRGLWYLSVFYVSAT